MERKEYVIMTKGMTMWEYFNKNPTGFAFYLNSTNKE